MPTLFPPLHLDIVSFQPVSSAPNFGFSLNPGLSRKLTYVMLGISFIRLLLSLMALDFEHTQVPTNVPKSVQWGNC